MERLSVGTRKQYACVINRLTCFVKLSGEQTLDKPLFLRYLGAIVQAGRGCNTQRQQLSALRHHQATTGLWLVDGRAWSLDVDLTEAVKGVAFGSKSRAPQQTGAITRSMLEDLVQYSHATNRGGMVPAILLAWGAALRFQQVVTLEIGCLLKGEEGYFLKIKKDKRVRATSRRGEYHDKPLLEEFVPHYYAQAGTRQSGEWLFPPNTWKYVDFLLLMKEAATALGWLPTLEWVFHSIRHGGTPGVAAAAVANAATAMTERTRHHYSRTNAQREAVAARPTPKRPAPKKAVPKTMRPGPKRHIARHRK